MPQKGTEAKFDIWIISDLEKLRHGPLGCTGISWGLELALSTVFVHTNVNCEVEAT